tara:strand:- start:217 stop:489 length:273 start_codon:yes stop_codon:yes gene_type:complete
LSAFASWAFEENTAATIIAGGHSLWFREFFKIFLSGEAKSRVEVKARKDKMANGGVVAFKLVRAPRKGSPGKYEYKILEGSICQVHRGCW